MKTFFLSAGLLVLFLLSAFPAAADPTSPASMSTINSTRRELPAVSNGTLGAQGGNVTQVNIDALSITNTWQGYYGNITGNIHLDDASNNSFYVWGNGTLNGEIYASRNATVDWSTINCTDATEIAAEESYLGVAATDGDSVSNTYNDFTHPGFYVGSQQVFANTCNSTNGFVSGAKSATDFYQLILADNASTIVYSTVIDYQTVGFDGTTMDFQLLVGENQHGANTAATTYYFFVEIN